MTPAIADVTRLFEEMQESPPGSPGTRRRRLRTKDLSAEVYLEVDFPDRVRALNVAAHDAPKAPRLTDTAELRYTFEGRRIRVAATSLVETEMFNILVADLVLHMSAAPDGPGAALVRRMASWHRMLAAGLRTGLSAQAQLGLYGELLVLRELAIPAWGPAAVAAWVGPLRADQDFRRPGMAVEVKCTGYRDAGRCRISNEAQLDADGIGYLVLMHQSVRTSATIGVSLPELVDAVRAESAVASDAALFEDRLLHAGWLDLHREQYERERYELAARRCYHVGTGFPSITRRQLPAGVSAVAYSVDLEECRDYLVPQTDLVQHLASADLGATQ
ncbi:PD-(D/E)XK motif protein [Micromonospora sp. NPDC049275]|uniref:PD-(D/E)XK motif protein n=1 Tax=Micromonospora sp. NPDC049275 TaxID=3364268 RepID=UPI003712DE98